MYTRKLLQRIVSSSSRSSTYQATHPKGSQHVFALFSTTAHNHYPRGTARDRTIGRIPERGVDLREQNSQSPAGYDYFAKFTKQKESEDGNQTENVPSVFPAASGIEIMEKLKQELDLSQIKPALPTSSPTLIPFVNESETLANLVKLGVDLSKVEKDKVAANFLLKADYQNDLQPYFVFLNQIGVPDTELGSIITKHPSLFQENLEDVEVRLNYFKSKKFTQDMIVRIVTKMPSLLSIQTVKVDTQLGFLQKEFSLTGDEVRAVISRYPKLAVWNQQKIEDNIMTLDKFLGFSKEEQKKMLIAVPKIFTSDRHGLTKRFDYLHNTLEIPHSLIVAWPSVLRQRTHRLKQRHAFLLHRCRAQYDPKKENYVSLKMLCSGTDGEFCRNVAKSSMNEFNDFLKTL